MNELETWIESAQGQIGTVKFDYNLCKPHRLFKYPEFPLLDKEALESPTKTLKALLSLKAPETVSLFSDFKSAILSALNTLQSSNPKTVYALHPFVPELVELSTAKLINLLPIPHDPDEWPAFIQRCPRTESVYFLSHPNYGDGFCWPQSFFSKIVLEIAALSNDNLLIIDSRGTLFSLDANPAGRIEPIIETGLLKNSKVFQIDSVFPVRSPLGPYTSWLMSLSPATPIAQDETHLISVSDQHMCTRSLLAFQSRQGPAMAEFQRRILVLQRSLRAFADKLMPLSRPPESKISIPYWPTQGFHLKIDLNPSSKITNPDVGQEVAFRVARDFNILTIPGGLMGCPNSLILNYALPLNHAEKAADRLGQALNTVL